MSLDPKEDNEKFVTIDYGISQAATSFFSPYSNKRDPRCRVAFDIFTTYYCNDYHLNFFGPSESITEYPTLLKFWLNKDTSTHHPDLKLESKAYEDVINSVKHPLCKFLEGNPNAIASWVDFQFSDDVMDEVRPVLDALKYALLHISDHAVKLIESGYLENTLSSFNKIDFIEPPEMSDLIGKEGVISPHHLAISFILMNAVRGRCHIYNFAKNEDLTNLTNHWIRQPAVTATIPGESYEILNSKKSHLFPWGTILRKSFEKDPSYLNDNEQKIFDILDFIRTNGPQYVLEAEYLLNDEISEKQVDKASLLIMECLVKAGVYPKYKNSKLAQKLTKGMRSLLKTQGLINKNITDLVSINVQSRWIRGIESKLRLKFMRNNMWDIFDSGSITPTMKEYANKTFHRTR